MTILETTRYQLHGQNYLPAAYFALVIIVPELLLDTVSVQCLDIFRDTCFCLDVIGTSCGTYQQFIGNDFNGSLKECNDYMEFVEFSKDPNCLAIHIKCKEIRRLHYKFGAGNEGETIFFT